MKVILPFPYSNYITKDAELVKKLILLKQTIKFAFTFMNAETDDQVCLFVRKLKSFIPDFYFKL